MLSGLATVRQRYAVERLGRTVGILGVYRAVLVDRDLLDRVGGLAVRRAGAGELGRKLRETTRSINRVRPSMVPLIVSAPVLTILPLCIERHAAADCSGRRGTVGKRRGAAGRCISVTEHRTCQWVLATPGAAGGGVVTAVLVK